MKFKVISKFFLTFLILVSHTIVQAQLSVVPFVNDVTKVTDITNCGDDRLFIAEQQGKVFISDLDGNLNTTPFLSITDRVLDASTEQGLLGVAFSPNYLSDGRFYINYINNSGNTVISRFKVSAMNPDIADSLNEEILYIIVQPYSNHNGGSMQFGSDGFLYIASGDGGAGGDPGNRAQDLQLPLGKMLRMDVNDLMGFVIPSTNPFYASANANQLIWSYGLRNPWRFSFDKLTGDMWIGDVGQGLWEEINYQKATSEGGENYGWRCFEANYVYDSTCVFPLQSYVKPIYAYPHFPGCSVTGGYVYRGAKSASMYGKYFFTDYCIGDLRSLAPNDTGGFDHVNYGNFSNFVFTTFGQDKYGELYLGKNTTGVSKLVDSNCKPVAFISEADTIIHGEKNYLLKTPFAKGLKFQWYLNGQQLASAVSSDYLATTSGNYKVVVFKNDSCYSISKQITLVLQTDGGFVMYPNPTENFTELGWPDGAPAKKKLEVFDALGRLCQKVNINPGSLSYLLDTGTFNKGIFMVRMTINGNVYTQKLMIK